MTLTPRSLADRHGLGPEAAGQLEALAAFIAADSTAPTTVTGLGAVLRDHLADSLIALDLPEVRRATTIADLGSGAGFPGLPLAIALRTARVSLVESNGRKCEFIAAAAAACRARNAQAVHARAEEWADGLRACDLAVARALASLAVVAEYAAPLLRIGGALVAWRGRRDPADEDAGAAAARELGLEVSEPIEVRPYPEALHRHLHVMVKRDRTPDRFPRRAGVARRRPLGAVRP
ncbi:MAG: 16S rRNA (guanine(527)-N(7))-methyltransferase RsmG [Solirubrobacteraceae bacterium]